MRIIIIIILGGGDIVGQAIILLSKLKYYGKFSLPLNV
jgi:hypothetical protein